jgi:hypothetical protein
MATPKTEPRGRRAAADEIAANNASPAILAYVDELEAGIREAIPVLEKHGRVVLALKLRELVDG